jgi:hypothetical protein
MTSPFSSGIIRHTIPVTTVGNSQPTVITAAGRDGTVASVTFTPVATVTGANTNTRKYELVNKGAAGSGTTVIATLQMDSGVNATAFVPKTITLSGTPANLVIAAGDVLTWNSTAVGTGIADPGGLVNVTINNKYA